MPELQPCNPICRAEATSGCDYPNNPSVGDIHFDGGGQNRFEVWDGNNWVAASFEPGTIIRILRPTPFQDLYYQIRPNGVGYIDVTAEEVLNVCGNDAGTVNLAQHRVVLQRCVPHRPECEADCDCHDGPHKPEGITIPDLTDLIVEEVFDSCANPPDAGQSCGDLRYAVWQECPEGGYKLASFSPDSANRFFVRPLNVPWLPKDQNFVWPTSPVFQNGDGPYTFEQLRDDFDAGNGTVDETRMRNNIVAEGSIQLACPTAFDYDIGAIFARSQIADINAAYSMRVQVHFRVSADGGPWQYVTVPATGELHSPVADNALNTTISGGQQLGRRRLPAGNIRVQMFFTARDGDTPAPINVNTTDPSTNTSHANALFTPAIG